MNNTNLPPFYVGQKVAVVHDIDFGITILAKKGEVFTVFGIEK